MKRVFDIVVSFTGLMALSPILLVFIFLIWIQDFKSPFYIAPRVAKDRKSFQMVKLRSMVINADKNGVNSTAVDDKRITWVGHLIRKFKLDELSQLWNVLIGDMSLVGPRPNVRRDVDLYTKEELKLLCLKPGITDISSIVFSDEGEILAGAEDPDLKYNQIIRPWKSRLCLIYIQHLSLWLDIKLIVLTLVAIANRRAALNGISKILANWDIPPETLKTALRTEPLYAYPPPGSDSIMKNRKVE